MKYDPNIAKIIYSTRSRTKPQEEIDEEQDQDAQGRLLFRRQCEPNSHRRPRGVARVQRPVLVITS
jgi:hypothetical protein